MNQFKNEIAEPIATLVEEPKKASPPISVNISRLTDLLWMPSREQVIGWMPYVFFVSFLLLIYISNSYYAEKNIRRIDKLNSELKELRWEYITIKSQLMFKSKQSEVAKQIESSGLKESTTPPRKLIIRQEN